MGGKPDTLFTRFGALQKGVAFRVGGWDRPQLQRLLDQLRKGDVLVVWKLDRLSRSLRGVLTIKQRLGGAKAGDFAA